jgi:small-conductance mechanosensitive channel
MNFSFQELLRVASELFTTPILKVGETVISLSSLFQLVLSILVVVVFSRVLKNFLKQQLLVKLRIAEGNREEIATIISYGAGIISPL